MMAKIYDALTILLILTGIAAVILIIYYRDVLFKRTPVVDTDKNQHEYLVASSVAVESEWLNYVGDLRGAQILLPEGYEAVLYVADLNNPQVMEYIESENLVLVTERNTGNIVVLEDIDFDGSVDSKRVFISSLPRPRGIKYTEDGDLYVGVENSILVFEDFLTQLQEETSNYSELMGGLPSNEDGLELDIGLSKLFVSYPASCEYCIETDKRRGSIVEYDLNGAQEKIYATGLKNANRMGFIQGSLVSSELSISNNVFEAKDEFNIIKKDNNYGWPYYVNYNEIFTPFSSQPPVGINPVSPAFLFNQDSHPMGFEFDDKGNSLKIALKGDKKIVDINYINGQVQDFALIRQEGNELLDPVDIIKYREGTLVLDREHGLIFFIRSKST